MADEGIADAGPNYAECGRMLAELLASAGIRRMIVVDDRHGAPAAVPSDEDLVAAVLMEPSKYEGLGLLVTEPAGGDTELLRASVLRALESPERRAAIANRVADVSASQGSDRDDTACLSVLDLLKSNSPDIELELLSAAGWDERKTGLDANEKVLLIADLDFSTAELPATYGMSILREARSQRDSAARCALLTHRVRLGEELAQWDQLATEHGLNKDDFVVIAKDRLASESPDISGFLHLLRLSILSRPIAVIKSGIRARLLEDGERVSQELEKWNVHDFNQAVFCSSRAEGVWEGETLSRIVSHLVVTGIRGSILEAEEIRSEIESARRASKVVIPGAPYRLSGSGRQALAYQRSEIYMGGSDVNRHHLPLAVGDLFDEGVDGGRLFVLLAQPCDLMVREDGRRARDSDDAGMVSLCAVKTRASKTHGYSYELRWWDLSNGESLHVHMAEAYLVRSAILDLCVLDVDGRARFTGALNAAVRTALSPAWAEHAVRLVARLAKEADSASKVAGVLDRDDHGLDVAAVGEAKRRLVPFVSNTDRFRTTLTETGFTVNLRRVGRIAPAVAADLLRAFSRHQSRSAFERAVVDDA